MSENTKYPIINTLISLLDNGEINEQDINLGIRRIKNEKQLKRFPESIFNQYVGLLEEEKIGCTGTWEDDLYFYTNALKAACYEIEKDLCVMLARREDLVGKDEKTEYAKLARGKIAGITTFRLAKTNIIQMSRRCVSCYETSVPTKPKCNITTLNTVYAIKCGLHFINKRYTDISEDIRKELLYTLTKRHTNQETLGLVFDTFKNLL